MDFPVGGARVVFGRHGRDALDRDLEIGHVLARGSDHSHRQRLDRGRKLVAHLFQRPVGLRRDEHPLSLCEQMRDQRGGGVGLARAGRPLHQGLCLGIDLPEDPQLHVIDREREKWIIVNHHQRAGGR